MGSQRSMLLGSLLAIAVGAAPGATLIVDNDACSSCQPPCYDSITCALADAQHNDTILVKYGTGVYVEQVLIKAKTTDSFYLTLRGEASPDGYLPRIEHAYEGERTSHAAIEIMNGLEGDPECADMRVTVDGFEVHGHNKSAALSVRPKLDDVDQDLFIGLDIRNNVLRCDNCINGTVQLGAKSASEPLYYQSVSWGEFVNNEVTNTASGRTDAVTAHHFIGHFANNRLAGVSEGLHVGLGTIDFDRHGPGDPPYDSEYFETVIEHNALFQNPDEGIHFTHGSKGIVYNNIVIGTGAADGKGNGIFAGNSVKGDDICADDPDECMSDSLEALIDEVEVQIRNNTLDRNRFAVRVDEEAYVYLLNNIIARTEGNQAVALRTHELLDPQHFTSAYNLFWGNDRDYNPEDPLKSPTDLNEDDPGGSHPRFQGWLDPQQTMYSYMLKTNHPLKTVCGYPVGANRSRAIDAGTPPPDYLDERPPGLHEDYNDIGAYGGPDAVWDPTGVDPCLEYVEPPQ